MKTLIFSISLLLCVICRAQKVPNVQKVAVGIPNGVKIDGNIDEWNNKLLSYNKATQLEYTMADDANNIYIAIRCTDIGVISKILAGGITLNIDVTNKKNSNGPSITFPYTSTRWGTDKGGVTKLKSIVIDSTTLQAALKNIKFFHVNNFKGLIDSTLSVYNDLDIQTKMLYHNKSLVCEMLIPRELIELESSTGPFAYQIKLPGIKNDLGLPAGGNPNRPPNHPLNILYGLSAATDFWGEYTLSK